MTHWIEKLGDFTDTENLKAILGDLSATKNLGGILGAYTAASPLKTAVSAIPTTPTLQATWTDAKAAFLDEAISAAKTLTVAERTAIRQSVCLTGDPASSIGKLLFDNLNAPVGSIPTNPTLQTVWTDAKAGFLTGDSYVRLGDPAGASVSADIAAIRGDLERLATKQITLSTAAVPVTETLFTVTGEVEVLVIGYIDVAVTSGGALTLEVGVAGATAGLIAQTALGNLLIDLLWVDATPAVIITKPSNKVIANGADIIHTIAGADATAGQITYYCWWRPLSSDGDVVAVV